MENEPIIKKLRRSGGQITRLISQWEQSGQSRRIFCKEHQIKPSTFHGWIARRKKQNPIDHQATPVFVPLQLNKQGREPFAEINFSNGISVSLFHSVPASYLRGLFHK